MKEVEFYTKTAIITGAGQGIGFEIGRLLTLQGANVVLNDIDEALANEAAAKLSATGGSCLAFAGDSSDQHVVQAMVKYAVDQFGTLDIIIANAGITLFGDFFSYPSDSLYKVLNTNIAGTFFLAQAAANQMRIQGSGGSMLFTSSVTAHQAHKNLTAYGASKAALEMMAKTLVIELSEFGINVNTIAPGATLTERTIDDPTYQEVWSKITPMGKPASIQDIAHAALFLVSDKSKHITGQSLVIDGGWSAISPSPF